MTVRHWFIVVTVGFILPYSLAYTATTTLWPEEEWLQDNTVLDQNKIQARTAMENYLFPDPNKNLNGLSTNSLIIIKGGKILYERYDKGYSKDSRQRAWSVSKSITNAVLGIAIKQGKIKLTDSICVYLNPPTTKFCKITIDHLVRHSSGLNWVESYEKAKRLKESSVLALLYGQGIHNMTRFVFDLHKLVHTPGTYWNYSSGDSNLLMDAISKAYGPEAKKLPWTHIFNPLGMHSVLWEQDGKGVYVASTYLYATARDLARFGYLFLRKGKWKNEQVLSEEWIQYSTTLAPALRKTPQILPGTLKKPTNSYGAQWWLNLPIPEQNLPEPWPQVGKDVYAAIGHWGQYIVIMPQLDTVIVRLGNDRTEDLDANKFLTLVQEFVR